MKYCTRPPQQCHEIKDDLALMALGLLNGTERLVVFGHVQHCRSCRRELDGLTRVARQLRHLTSSGSERGLNIFPDHQDAAHEICP
jgi:hypothetical protein